MQSPGGAPYKTCPGQFCKIQKQPFADVLQKKVKNLVEFTGKHLCNFSTPAELFSCEFWEILKSTC